jgi:protein SCO1/2
MTHITRAALLAAALLLGACSREEPIGKARVEKGEALEVGAFELLERSGKPLSEKELKGKVWVGALIFTTCTGPCPAICFEMAKLQEDFKDAPDFRLVTTTVNPAHDTADVLAKFAKGYDADPDRWYFLTGKGEDIERFAINGLRLAADTTKVGHSPDLVLVDRNGRIRDYFHQTDAADMKRLRGVIRGLLAEKAP